MRACGHRVPACGRRRSTATAPRNHGAARAGRRRLLQRPASNGRAPATATGSGWTASACDPTRARASSRRARTGLQIVDPDRVRLDRRRWRGRRPRRAGDLRDARRHLHAGRHLGGGRRATAGARAARHHDDRDDAGRRLSRRASAGATTASTCSRRRGCTERPTICARFVDRAHALGLGVILDVVYNHLGPDGNYLASSRRLLHRRYKNDWGDALNFEGPRPAREFFVENAALLDRRIPLRRAAARRHAGHPRRVARSTSSRR